MKTPAERLFDDLIIMLIEEKSVHDQERVPLDRTRAVDHVLGWFRERDPQGDHREYVARELRAMLRDRVPEMSYYLEESVLQRLEAEDWFRKST